MTRADRKKTRSHYVRELLALRYLSPRQLFNWRRYGFIVSRKFFDDDRVAAANLELDRLWLERHRANNPLVIDIYGNPPDRKLFRNASDADRECVYKLDDVYL